MVWPTLIPTRGSDPCDVLGRPESENSEGAMSLKMNATFGLRSCAARSAGVRPPRGAPLSRELRSCAERILGEDLSNVRVYVSSAPSRLGAIAFTMGSQIHVAPEAYDPTSAQGVALLGHELAHVIQQRRGRARNPKGYGVAIVDDAGLEAEADRVGAAIAASCLGGQVGGCGCGGGRVKECGCGR